ncbi:hypothetical protein [Streptosporangium carneum]|uniref:Uncharacterized protein n=1 Tax=Streptosporangium carneum TaxID=47481 RepID=A0A9W6MCV7_9ACTN|nr:hypothetical protein [Streptosporangium carneum]GLK09432.1 hypothetical protein GCM10017600_28380 [Streptosporangium carneum]
MIDFVQRLGDRMLARLVPAAEARALALDCWCYSCGAASRPGKMCRPPGGPNMDHGCGLC